MGVIPFYLASGTAAHFAPVGDDCPFYLSDGTAAFVALVV